MSQYLLCTYQPDGPPPPSLDLEQITRDLTKLSDELRDAGAWVFASHLTDASAAMVVRAGDGEAEVTDGPYVTGAEHAGGVTLIEASDLDAALSWAKRLSQVTGLPVEVRELLASRRGLE
jgi:hypothetical protein